VTCFFGLVFLGISQILDLALSKYLEMIERKDRSLAFKTFKIRFVHFFSRRVEISPRWILQCSSTVGLGHWVGSLKKLSPLIIPTLSLCVTLGEGFYLFGFLFSHMQCQRVEALLRQLIKTKQKFCFTQKTKFHLN
jgi:hypothetical protein